jgi:hypothetical protein
MRRLRDETEHGVDRPDSQPLNRDGLVFLVGLAVACCGLLCLGAYAFVKIVEAIP